MKKFKFKIDGNEFEVSVNEIEQNIAEVEVNGTPFTVEIERQEKSSSSTMIRKPAGKVAPIATPTRSAVATAVKSPLPGSIIKVLVTPGQTVKRGDVLLTVESMKMENNILAEHDGVVKKIYVQAGQSVMQGDVLIDFDGSEIVVSAPVPVAVPRFEAPVQTVSNPKSVGSKLIKSPLPGNVISVFVKSGQAVKRGDLLMTLESMKMENSILCEKDGVVKTVYVKSGQSVMQDDVLFDLE